MNINDFRKELSPLYVIIKLIVSFLLTGASLFISKLKVISASLAGSISSTVVVSFLKLTFEDFLIKIMFIFAAFISETFAIVSFIWFSHWGEKGSFSNLHLHPKSNIFYQNYSPEKHSSKIFLLHKLRLY